MFCRDAARGQFSVGASQEWWVQGCRNLGRLITANDLRAHDCMDYMDPGACVETCEHLSVWRYATQYMFFIALWDDLSVLHTVLLAWNRTNPHTASFTTFTMLLRAVWASCVRNIYIFLPTKMNYSTQTLDQAKVCRHCVTCRCSHCRFSECLCQLDVVLLCPELAPCHILHIRHVAKLWTYSSLSVSAFMKLHWVPYSPVDQLSTCMHGRMSSICRDICTVP